MGRDNLMWFICSNIYSEEYSTPGDSCFVAECSPSELAESENSQIAKLGVPEMPAPKCWFWCVLHTLPFQFIQLWQEKLTEQT